MAYAQPLAAQAAQGIGGIVDSRGNPMQTAQAETEQQRKTRKRIMDTAYKAYAGQMDEPLKVKPGDLNDNAIIGLMRPIVETGVSFLFGKAVTFEVETLNSSDKPAPMVLPGRRPAKPTPSPAQDALDLVWRANKQSTFLKKLATNGGIFGHSFLKTVANGVMYKGKLWPRLVLLDSTQMDILSDPDDIDLVTQYVQEWQGVDDDGLACTRRQRTIRLGVNGADADRGGRTPIVLGGPSRWQIVDEHLSAGGIWLNDYTELWPYSWCPIHECQNLPEANSKWGAPNLTAALIRLNGLLNFLVSNATRIAKHHAHPKPWTAGARMDEWRIGVDEAINMADPTARVGQLEMNGQGMASLLQLIDGIRDYIDEISHVPGIALGRLKDMPRGGISGIALELMFAALLEQTEDKRELYGDLLDSLNAHLLEMCGQQSDLKVTIHWPNVLPQDVATMATSAPLLLQAGISQDSVIQWLGWNPDEEAEKNREALEDAQEAAAADAANNPMPAMNDPMMQSMPVAPGQASGQPPAFSSAANKTVSQQSQPGSVPPSRALNHPAMQRARAITSRAARS